MTTTFPSPPAGRVRPRARPGPVARRVDYAVAIAVDVVLLLLVNRSPGWAAVPFLTADAELVVGPVNATIVTGLVVGVVSLVADPPWLRALGEVATTAVGLAALVAIWQVWPLDVTLGWDMLARLAVGIGVAGSVIGIVAAMVRLVR